MSNDLLKAVWVGCVKLDGLVHEEKRVELNRVIIVLAGYSFNNLRTSIIHYHLPLVGSAWKVQLKWEKRTVLTQCSCKHGVQCSASFRLGK